MNQESLFDSEARSPQPLAVSMVGSAKLLTKAQKQFNKWVEKIKAQRLAIEQWRDFIPKHMERCSQEMDPLLVQLRARRIEMVDLLDAAMDGKALSKLQRASARDVLLGQLDELLSEEREPRLESIFDKYSDVSFSDSNDGIQEMLEDLFAGGPSRHAFDPHRHGSGPHTQTGQPAPEVDAMPGEPSTSRGTAAKKKSKKDDKKLERERLREDAAQRAKQSVREIYRKLASALHPDREPDQAQRDRKTLLMQQVNKAYDDGNLLALLELQLAIEQIDHADLAGMSEERVGHFNEVLKEQSRSLDEELSTLTMPFSMIMNWNAAKLTPQIVSREFSSDLQEQRMLLQQLEADLIEFRDIKCLKAFLKTHQPEPPDDDLLFAMIDLLESSDLQAPKPRRRR